MARIIADKVNIPTAGTRVQLSTVKDNVLSITFKGSVLNKGTVFIGDSTVTAAVAFSLEPGESIPLLPGSFVQDTAIPESTLLSNIYIDAANNGDDIEYWALVT